MEPFKGKEVREWVGVRVLSNRDIDELNAWTNLLKVMCDGIVKPNNIKYILRDIEEAEMRGNLDLEELKKCCLSESTIREAKDFKPYIFPILERIKELTGLNKDPIFGDRKERR